MNVKPRYGVGDKLKITKGFLDKTKWSGNTRDYDYFVVDSFRTNIYQYDTPIIDGDYALYYIVRAVKLNPFHDTGAAYRFNVADINLLPKYKKGSGNKTTTAYERNINIY